jgi:hypothetical protein
MASDGVKTTEQEKAEKEKPRNEITGSRITGAGFTGASSGSSVGNLSNLSPGAQAANGGLAQIMEKLKPDWHTNRNENQDCPETCLGINSSEYKDDWHSKTLSLHGEKLGYATYRGNSEKTEGYQCTYAQACTGRAENDKFIDLIDDPKYAGSYDYSPPNGAIGTVGHIVLDVAPALIFGP